MNVLSYLIQFKHKPWNPAKPDGRWSTSDLIRACKNGTILVNGKTFEAKAPLPDYVESVVFFPASKLRRTTYAGIFERETTAPASSGCSPQ